MAASRASCAVAQFDTDGVREFLAELHERGISRASAARRLAALRTFARYLVREEQLADDPDRARRRARARSRRCRRICRSTRWTGCSRRRMPRRVAGRRDRAILELFYASGLRLSELVDLDLEDVNLAGRMVRVRGKGGKERLVPFNQTAAEAMRAMTADAPSAFGRAAPRVATRPRASPHAPSAHRAVPEPARRPPHHAQRRSHRPALRARGGDRAGHQPARAAAHVRDAPAAGRRRPPRDSGTARPRAPETTQRYTHLDVGRLMEVYKDAHPRAPE